MKSSDKDFNSNVFALNNWKSFCQTLIGKRFEVGKSFREDEIILATHRICTAIRVTKRIAAHQKFKS